MELALTGGPRWRAGMLARPGEFIASAYDFAEHLLTSHAERMTKAIKPSLGAAKGAAAKKQDTK